MTHAYEYTVPGARVCILDVSRSTKSKDVSEENSSPPLEVSGSRNTKMAGLFRMINKHFKKQDKKFEFYESKILIDVSMNCSFGL